MAQGGFEALSDAELLALLLGGGSVSRCHAMVNTARTLLARFGGLRGLGGAAVGRLERERGMGPARAAILGGAFELGKRLGERRLERGAVVRSSADVFRHCCHSLAHLKKEVFRVVLLDGKNRVLKDARVSEGSLTTSLVHPREVFVPVIEESAAALILVHNHPSGDPAPSKEDIEITRRLKQVGEILGVRVLDHVIVGDGCYVSLAEEGLL